MMNRKIAVIFDMDGVIVDNDVYHFRAWGELCNSYGLSVDKEDIKSWFGNTNSMILKRLFGNNISNKMMEEMGMEKERLYREIYFPEIQLTPGLLPFLINLKEFGFLIAIATSAPTENVDFILDNTGIRSYFHKIIDSSMISQGKPSPEIYLKASELLKINPSECIIFEDSFHGIESARRAGMKVIGVATTHSSDKLLGTIKTINDFTEISPVDVIQLLNKNNS
jgi:beta-phosphoglucomutase